MVQVHEYNHPDDGWTDLTAYVQTVKWGTAGEKAEEGDPAHITVVFDDPGLDLVFRGHRAYRIRETASAADDDIVFGGFIWDIEIGRGDGDHFHHAGRTHYVKITDRNAIWQRKVFEASDDSDRPEETDVERVAWALASNEAGAFDDVTTYVDSTGGVDMDAVDYDGQTFSQIMDDCAQQSGRNWFCWYRRNASNDLELVVWYGFGDTEDYASPLSLSNDPDDLDAVLDDESTVWPYSEDTRLREDYSRVYSKVRVPYDGGFITVARRATGEMYAARETVMPSVNVKTKAKAEARGRQYLSRCRHPEERINTSVEVPRELVTQLRAGMLINFKAVHLPGYADGVDMRIVLAQPRPVNHGQNYEVALELLAPLGLRDGDAEPGSDEVYAVLYAGEGPFDGAIWYGSTGDAPGAGWGAASTGHVGPTATVGPLVFMSGGTPKARSPYSGIQVDGGNIDDTTIKAGFSIVGVAEGNVSVIYEVLVNGAVVGSATQSSSGTGARHFGSIGNVTVTGVDLVDGDEVKTRVRKTGIIHYFIMPWGSGHNGEALEIIGGTVS